MPANRFFVDYLLQSKDQVVLEKEELHHFKVMRILPGDFVELVNGKGQLATALLQKMERNEAILEIQDVITEKPPFPLVLCQALCKFNHLEYIVEKATELGMTELWLFPAQKSEKKELSANQLNRLHLLTISALKQCGRLYLPPIKIISPIKQWNLEMLRPYASYFGSMNKQDPFLSTVIKKQNSYLCAIGPESGFSEEEICRLKELKIVGVRFNPNILRVETAACAAICLFEHL